LIGKVPTSRHLRLELRPDGSERPGSTVITRSVTVILHP
jgi:hypothetical protein